MRGSKLCCHLHLPVGSVPVSVDVEGVVVELGVALQPDPLVPTGGHVLARVLVQVLPEIT